MIFDKISRIPIDVLDVYQEIKRVSETPRGWAPAGVNQALDAVMEHLERAAEPDTVTLLDVQCERFLVVESMIGMVHKSHIIEESVMSLAVKAYRCKDD